MNELVKSPLNYEGNKFCYFDGESEILTKRGWISIKDLNVNDLYFSREPNTGTLDWLNILKIENYTYNGDMYKYIGKNIDLFTFPEHKLFVNRLHTRERNKNDEFLEAKYLFKSSLRFISAGGKWYGTSDENIVICGEVFNKKDFAYLLGIFLTDGSVSNQGAIVISQTKCNIKDKILDILNKLNIKYSAYEGKNNNVNFYITRKYLPYFKQFYLKENRTIPVEIKESNVEILKSLLEGIVDGDGCSDRRRIYIGSKSLVNDIQEVIYKVGLSSNYQTKKPKTTYLKSEDRYITSKKDYYVVSINNKPYLSHIHTNEEYVKFKGVIYCLTIKFSTSILVRREGKSIWC